MSKNKHKVFPKEGDSKLKEANRNLRSRVKQLQRKVKNLEQEKKELLQAFEKSVGHVKDVTDYLTVEQNIDIVEDRPVRKPVTEKDKLVQELKEKYGRKE